MLDSKGPAVITKAALQKSGLKFPPVIFGTSGLGNLYLRLEESVKHKIVYESIYHSPGLTFFDTAGKYGAGLALECLGRSFKELQLEPQEVVISNKLGWFRTKLHTEHPTFEVDIWKGLEYDAVQKISYEGILECFEQGNDLLQAYVPQLVSVHDPDEYLAKAKSESEAKRLYQDILDAYRALEELKAQGKVSAIGVGAKDWRMIEKISQDVDLDWVMIANSMTVLKHPKNLILFMQSLAEKKIQIINAAVFQSGFLIGGDYCDYKFLKPDTAANQALFRWRDDFFTLCKKFDVKPAVACAQFSLQVPGVVSIALSSTDPEIVRENASIDSVVIPLEFWTAMKDKGLISKDCAWVG
ncbi:aldo/keto reductase [Cesiribacter sp. SM1]|uniref:aldo/keto reductase n=1 Tax=Cesiribacter sp. SM1 TaxID=2861196 RepID=UPI001CD21053|nr:aldo/keto reductase [Cesiribacter sp. SM1]